MASIAEKASMKSITPTHMATPPPAAAAVVGRFARERHRGWERTCWKRDARFTEAYERRKKRVTAGATRLRLPTMTMSALIRQLSMRAAIGGSRLERNGASAGRMASFASAWSRRGATLWHWSAAPHEAPST